MAIMTAWGYNVETDDAALPLLLDADELYALTSGRFGKQTDGVDSVLSSVSSVIRGVCGWHVAPVLDVVETTQGPGRVIGLHSLCVCDVTKVVESGVELAEGTFEWAQEGMLRRCQWKQWPDAWRSVEVHYRSGLPADAMWALKTVAAQVASNALAAPAGVQSEQAGDVSVSYNSTASGVSGGVRLLASDVALLEPYIMPKEWS